MTNLEKILDKTWKLDPTALRDVSIVYRASVDSATTESHSLRLEVHLQFIDQQNLFNKMRLFLSMCRDAHYLYRIFRVNKEWLCYSSTEVLLEFLIKYNILGTHELMTELHNHAQNFISETNNFEAHNEAMVYMLEAQIIALSSPIDKEREEIIITTINKALSLETHIKITKDIESLRKLVIIFEKVSDLYKMLKMTEKQLSYLKKAYNLAYGDADLLARAIVYSEQIENLKK